MKRAVVVGIVGLAIGAIVVFAILRLSQSRTPLYQVSRGVRALVREKDLTLRGTSRAEAATTWSLVRTFYRQRNYRPAWVDGRGPRDQAGELAEVVAHCGQDGLDPRDYDLVDMARELRAASKGAMDEPPTSGQLARLDLRFTYTYLRYANHLLNGRISPRSLDPEWRTSPRAADVVGHLERAVSGGAVVASLADLAPHDERYKRLREAWARYAKIAEQGGWPAVPPGRALRPGATGPRVAVLARRLWITGDLRDSTATRRYDGRLVDAVRRFQARHGLPPSGVVEAGTLAELNVPVESRLRQIQLNLERWRWLPQDLGARYIMVNIPDFRLDLYEGGRSVMHMAVVVGKRMSPTPMFSDQAVAVELNPYWNIPASIAGSEIVPAMNGDPEYLAQHHMRVRSPKGEELDPHSVDWGDTASGRAGYVLRQDPGADNPLGRVKIVLPNEYDVYLHDTPAGHLFDARERDFSHGCIRVEKPIDLAMRLLSGSPEAGNVEAILASGENHSIPLPRKIPVHILYFTSWVDEDGTIHFRPDVYGHDRRLDDALHSGRTSSFHINVESAPASI